MRRPTTARKRIELSTGNWLRSVLAGAALLAPLGARVVAQEVVAQPPVVGSELTIIEPSPLGQLMDYVGFGKPSEADVLQGASLDVETSAADASTMMVDPAVRPAANMAQYGYLASEFEPGPGPVSVAQPAAWISGPYLKAGPTTAVGGDLFGDRRDVGYTIAGGYRVPFGPAFDERMFLDFGGSYLSAYGRETRPIPGTISTLLNGQVIDTEEDPDLFNSTLKEAKRATVNAAFGWYWGDPIDVRSGDPQWRIGTRFGGRYGHIRGRFDEVAVGTPAANERFTFDYYNRTDTIGGLFVGAEAILLARDTRIGSTALTIDGELANDWIEFGAWGRGSLTTASVTLGFMLSR
jgi:hypothetical protein